MDNDYFTTSTGNCLLLQYKKWFGDLNSAYGSMMMRCAWGLGNGGSDEPLTLGPFDVMLVKGTPDLNLWESRNSPTLPTPSQDSQRFTNGRFQLIRPRTNLRINVVVINAGNLYRGHGWKQILVVDHNYMGIYKNIWPAAPQWHIIVKGRGTQHRQQLQIREHESVIDFDRLQWLFF